MQYSVQTTMTTIVADSMQLLSMFLGVLCKNQFLGLLAQKFSAERFCVGM